MSQEIKNDVFIFCGGLGTRLRPYTLDLPKPLLKIGDYFPLFFVCSQLKKCGFNTALVNYSYGEIFFKDASERIKAELDFEVRLIEESQPMGHSGVLKSAQYQIKTDKFLALNGDTLSRLSPDITYGLLDSCNEQTPMSVLAQPLSAIRPLGYNHENHLVSIGEKDFIKADIKGWVDSAGVYAMHKSMLDLVPKNEFFGLFGEDDIVERLVKSNKNVYIWLHKSPILQYQIGTVEEFLNLLNKPELIEQFS